MFVVAHATPLLGFASLCFAPSCFAWLYITLVCCGVASRCFAIAFVLLEIALFCLAVLAFASNREMRRLCFALLRFSPHCFALPTYVACNGFVFLQFYYLWFGSLGQFNFLCVALVLVWVVVVCHSFAVLSFTSLCIASLRFARFSVCIASLCFRFDLVCVGFMFVALDLFVFVVSSLRYLLPRLALPCVAFLFHCSIALPCLAWLCFAFLQAVVCSRFVVSLFVTARWLA